MEENDGIYNCISFLSDSAGNMGYKEQRGSVHRACYRRNDSMYIFNDIRCSFGERCCGNDADSIGIDTGNPVFVNGIRNKESRICRRDNNHDDRSDRKLSWGDPVSGYRQSDHGHRSRNTAGNGKGKEKYKASFFTKSCNRICSFCNSKWENKFSVRFVDAYFTVEAVMILPIAIGVIILTMYLWFYQYDRLLLDQDAAAIALRSAKGVSVQAGPGTRYSPAERVTLADNESKRRYKDKYVAWSEETATTSYRRGTIKVEMKGRVIFPFKSFLDFWDGSDMWDVSTQHSSAVRSEILILRTYRKGKQLVKNLHS